MATSGQIKPAPQVTPLHYQWPALLICAYQATSELEKLVRASRAAGIPHVLVVNDGSTQGLDVFERLSSLPRVRVVRFSENQGKGAALKAGFRWYLEHPELQTFKHVLCADADGQHRIEDILKICQSIDPIQDRTAFFGVRTFNSSVRAPLRSRMGNRISNFLMRSLKGIKITDTQTGLRAIPIKILHELTKIPERRFDFEMRSLIRLHELGVSLREIKIQTIYARDQISHFQTLSDSLLVTRSIFKSPFKSARTKHT